MKIKSGFAKRNIAGSEIVVPVGATSAEMNSMIALNEIGAFIWDALQKDITKEQLVAKILKEYEVDEATASKDVDKFVAVLEEHDLLEK